MPEGKSIDERTKLIVDSVYAKLALRPVALPLEESVEDVEF